MFFKNKNKLMNIQPKRQVFYSFHYENDYWRVQIIRNIGVVEGNEPVSANEWEEVRRKGHNAIKKWIDENMKYRSCLVVLVGEETADREWVRYEIEHAWNTGKGVVGIYIHNIKDSQGRTCGKGRNPFEGIFVDGEHLVPMSRIVKCYNPSRYDAYNYIKENLKDWIEEAIEISDQY